MYSVGSLSPHGHQESFHLPIVLKPHRRWDRITQDSPRSWRQVTMRLKRTTPISVFTNRVKRDLTTSLSATIHLQAATEGIICREINSTLGLDIKVVHHYRALNINYPPEAC